MIEALFTLFFLSDFSFYVSFSTEVNNDWVSLFVQIRFLYFAKLAILAILAILAKLAIFFAITTTVASKAIIQL